MGEIGTSRSSKSPASISPTGRRFKHHWLLMLGVARFSLVGILAPCAVAAAMAAGDDWLVRTSRFCGTPVLRDMAGKRC